MAPRRASGSDEPARPAPSVGAECAPRPVSNDMCPSDRWARIVGTWYWRDGNAGGEGNAFQRQLATAILCCCNRLPEFQRQLATAILCCCNRLPFNGKLQRQCMNVRPDLVVTPCRARGGFWRYPGYPRERPPLKFNRQISTANFNSKFQRQI